MRVLFLTTPFDERSRLDGSRRAVEDLLPVLPSIEASRLAGEPVTPLILARRSWLRALGARGQAPTVPITSCVPIHSSRASGLRTTAEVAWRLGSLPADVIHAFLTPRVPTLTLLRALRACGRRVVVTVTSLPEVLDAPLLQTLRPLELVVGSLASRERLRRHGVHAHVVPIPFRPPAATTPARWPRPYFLYAGDFGDRGLAWSISAMTQLADRNLEDRAAPCDLLVAARDKGPIDPRWGSHGTLSSRGGAPWLHVLGEVDDLIPWIAGARAVLVPTAFTRAKLDHPRVLLEALALRVPIVVGPSPTLAELVTHSLAHRVDAPEALAAVLEGLASRTAERHAQDDRHIEALLAPKSPEHVARQYVALYVNAEARGRARGSAR